MIPHAHTSAIRLGARHICGCFANTCCVGHVAHEMCRANQAGRLTQERVGIDRKCFPAGPWEGRGLCGRRQQTVDFGEHGAGELSTKVGALERLVEDLTAEVSDLRKANSELASKACALGPLI